ncbi:segregation and condensation protein A [Rubricoccus marinus]|uniref:Segregation and condensation protein A n=1 Tax=Rubricoccus marinus TaxID=716817 RepID=A0A259TYK5_9BACT|nr:segregation/condensation protein A [Rubricoccus marinus]OZC02791.1 hypothetical protein BSZ36_07275 [Rubricoccus marinus]
MHRVHLSEFEGPLDLLLFFIRRDELDIHDIPISRIADEYLETVRTLSHLDLDDAAEFVYTAALLIQIKARMLLPRPPAVDGEEPEDPRKELVERLLEYVQFREAGEKMGQAFEDRQRRFTRGAASDERLRHAPEAEEVTYRASLFDLLGALAKALERSADLADPYRHAVLRESVAVDEQKEWLLDRLASGERVRFADLMESRSKAFIIATFLAVLDLLQRQRLRLTLGVGAEDFALVAVPEPPDGSVTPTPEASGATADPLAA